MCEQFATCQFCEYVFNFWNWVVVQFRCLINSVFKITTDPDRDFILLKYWDNRCYPVSKLSCSIIPSAKANLVLFPLKELWSMVRKVCASGHMTM